MAILANRKSVTRRLSTQWRKVKAGDRLWCREHLVLPDVYPWLYAADRQPVMVEAKDETAMLVWAHHKQQDYCPSIHMPRFASRILLECQEDARQEQLQDITEEDAQREGVEKSRSGVAGYAMEPVYSYRTGFVKIWSTLHTKPKESWLANPPVVRVGEFRRID